MMVEDEFLGIYWRGGKNINERNILVKELICFGMLYY